MKDLLNINIEDLRLEANGEEKSSDYLLGTILIGGQFFHVEFVAVKLNKESGAYHAVDSRYENKVQSVCDLNESAFFAPVEYNKRLYCVSIVPHEM